MNKDYSLTVQAVPAQINSNFDAMSQQLENALKQYDLIVDVDSVKTAKTMSTQINKIKAEIVAKRKQIVSELSAPLKEFELEAKKLETLCESSRQKLQQQVKVFEDKKRKECLRLLDMELIVNYQHLGIREEFQTVAVDDLAIISNMTKSNEPSLTKKAYVEIESRVFKVMESIKPGLSLPSLGAR